MGLYFRKLVGCQ